MDGANRPESSSGIDEREEVMSIPWLMRRISGACLIILSCASCSGVPADKVPGVYQAEHKFAKEKIIINPDGTFRHEVILKSNAKTTVSTGKWDYNPSTGYISLVDGFMLVINGQQEFNPHYAKPLIGSAGLPMYMFMGMIRIGSDERLVYRKK